MSDTFTSALLVESRREQRYRVYWRAHLHLGSMRTLDARLRDISGSGLGLTAGEAVAVGTLLPITLGMPDAGGGPQLLAVQCSVRVANVVLAGLDYRMGALWVDLSPEVREAIDSWLRKLRYSGAVISPPQ